MLLLQIEQVRSGRTYTPDLTFRSPYQSVDSQGAPIPVHTPSHITTIRHQKIDILPPTQSSYTSLTPWLVSLAPSSMKSRLPPWLVGTSIWSLGSVEISRHEFVEKLWILANSSDEQIKTPSAMAWPWTSSSVPTGKKRPTRTHGGKMAMPEGEDLPTCNHSSFDD